MSIFNSLGSNYSSGFTVKNLFSIPKPGSVKKLRTVLSQHYGGEVLLTFKGREALELAFRRSGLPPGSAVGVNGFTCYVVYEAIKNAGYEVVYIDIAPNELNYDIEQLKKAHTQHKDLKAVVIQNTLGYPANMPDIIKFCRQNNILIVEDLAHSIGAVYGDGREVGLAGDFTMMSFSQDKPLDVVAGGALVDRRQQPSQETFKAPLVSSWHRTKIRFYPFWTWLIRVTYPLGLGRIIHFILKKLHLLATPMSLDIKGIHRMSSSRSGLLLKKWSNQHKEIAHRQQIAGIYQSNIPLDIQISQVKGQVTYLRFPLLVDNRESLINYLRQSGIYIGDTWYDAPIGPKKYMAQTDYKVGTCPSSEYLVARIVNLPTHMHVTPKAAQDICAKIKQWQALQQKS